MFLARIFEKVTKFRDVIHNPVPYKFRKGTRWAGEGPGGGPEYFFGADSGPPGEKNYSAPGCNSLD